MSQRRLTVLLMLPAMESGGTERSVVEIAEALVKSGHRAIVVSAGGRLVSRLISCGAEHVTRTLGTKSPLSLQHIPWLRRFLAVENVDVVDYQSRMPGWLIWLAWKSMPAANRPALISTVNGLHSTGFYSSIMCRGEHIVVVSNAVQNYIRLHYPFVRDKPLHIICRGVDSKQFPRGYKPDESWRTQFFRDFPEAAHRPVLTLAARLTRLKGHTDFLHMLAALRISGLHAHGLIVGDVDPRKESYFRELKRLVAQLNLEERVTFTGYRKDIREIFSISSVVLSLSSRPEAFGLTVAEALSLGIPVIGYNHGGVAEILAAQFPEGAVEPGNVDMLTRVAVHILEAGASAVPKPNRYELSSMQEQTLALYLSAAKAVRKD